MLNAEFQCVQLIIWYISLVTTYILERLPLAMVYCHVVYCILQNIKLCSKVCIYSVRMLSVWAVLGSHEVLLYIWLGAQRGTEISTRRELFGVSSAIFPKPSKVFEIELSDFAAENATLNVGYLQQPVQIFFGGVPTILVVHFMCFFMTLGRILLQHSILKNMFDPTRHQVDSWIVDVCI
jgi:hypothetical protein